MKTKYLLLILFGITGAVISSCTTPKNLYLETVGGGITSISYSDSADHITTNIIFLDAVDDIYRFNVVINNNSQKDVEIIPQNFYYTNPKVISKGKKEIHVNSIVNPEEIIKDADKDVSTAKTCFAATCLIDGICMIFSIFDNKTPADQKAAENEDRIGRAADGLERINSLQARLDFLKQTLLQNAKLKSGESVSGQIFFPVDKESDELMLYLPVNDLIFNFPFKKVWR